VIYVVKEKIAVQIGILDWNEKAKIILSGKRISFDKLDSLYGLLQSLLSGRSRTRMQLLEPVGGNEEVKCEIGSFAATHAQSICGSSVEHVSSLHSNASQWKDRAKSSIAMLHMYGKALAGEVLIAQEPPTMVDIRRVKDLVAEYGSMLASIPGYTDILQKVHEDARK
jgi:hypothetical protein